MKIDKSFAEHFNSWGHKISDFPSSVVENFQQGPNVPENQRGPMYNKI